MLKVKKHREKSRLIVYNGPEILVLQKLSDKKEYGLVGGFLEEGETPEIALIRETIEETGVQLTIDQLCYYNSVTIDQTEKQRLTKHYFYFNDCGIPFTIKEPHKFKAIKWVHWKKALKYLGKTDRTIVQALFKPLETQFKESNS